MAAANITIGSRFTRWLVLSEPFKLGYAKKVTCRCECGIVRDVYVNFLRNGRSKSCGCLRIEAMTTHGYAAKAIRRGNYGYRSWNAMIQRCTNPNDGNFHHYGGRGITVCERWLKFENFFADMGPRPGSNHSIERSDNEAGYFPENCKWATQLEQSSNTRAVKLITALGKTQHLGAWSREIGIDQRTIAARLKLGWTEEDAITRKLRPRKTAPKELRGHARDGLN